MENQCGHDVDAVVVRPAVEADAEAIGDLWEELVRFHRYLDPDLPGAASKGGQLYARRIVERLNDTHTRTLVAASDGLIVGYVLGVIVDLVPEMFAPENGGFLADIFVLESYRGQGIGRRLVDSLAHWFRSRGVDHMELYVAARNPSGRAFWDAMGARDVMMRMRVDL